MQAYTVRSLALYRVMKHAGTTKLSTVSQTNEKLTELLAFVDVPMPVSGMDE